MAYGRGKGDGNVLANFDGKGKITRIFAGKYYICAEKGGFARKFYFHIFRRGDGKPSCFVKLVIFGKKGFGDYT